MNPNTTPKGDSLASVIVRVTDEFRERLKRGEHPDPDEYAAQYPQFASDIREVLAAVQVMDPPAAAPPPPADLPPELADHPRYRILRELGRGGMGVVYLARHTVMDRDVVIKVISKSLLDQPSAVERFRREVQAAARLAHPNIVTAHDAEQAGEQHMLVMEYVEGLSLAHVLQRKGPLPVAFACHYARQAALGLQHAHEHGMVHRDIKPANLMLTPKGRVKILDFGLAKVASERGAGKGLTGSNAYMGTREYTAPEQATDARSADIRADLYSLGCTLYCLLTGHPPFEEDTAVKTILAHLEKAPQPLPELRREVSRELWAVVARLLAKEPGRRYQTPAEVAQALTPFCKAGPKKAPAPAPPPAVASPARATAAPQDTKGPGGRSKAGASRMPARAQTAPAEPEEEKPEAERNRRRRRKAARTADGKRWWLVGAGTAGVVVLLAGAMFWAGHRATQRQAENTAQTAPDRPPAQPSPPPDLAAVAPAAARPAEQQPTLRPAEVPGKAADAKPPEPKPEEQKPAGAPEAPPPAPPQPKPVAGAAPGVGGARPAPLDCTGPGGRTAREVREAQEAWAKHLGRHVEETVEVGGGVKMTFVLVPPGKFLMGSPKGEEERNPLKIAPFDPEAQHQVTVTEPFYLGKTELTQAQYQALSGNNPSRFKGGELPVETVDWAEARDYAALMTQKLGDQHLYRLPSEAEWEYACRGGRPSSQPFGVGDGHRLSFREANFNGTLPYGRAAKGPGRGSTCPVGSYPANALGLFDMHANVWEWCADWFGPYPQGEVTNPTGPAEGTARVIRGGSWKHPGLLSRAAHRGMLPPGFKYDDLGLRLARSIPSGGK
jgi:formylglycine-generating enzyme required for sulfatase activity/tRNA A-37 threonylcarbamoyl transferase component Bud32